MHMQIHSEHDQSHGEGGEERDGTAHQDVPVARPVKDAVPSQSLEVTLSNTCLYCPVYSLYVVLLRRVQVHS